VNAELVEEARKLARLTLNTAPVPYEESSHGNATNVLALAGALEQSTAREVELGKALRRLTDYCAWVADGGKPLELDDAVRDARAALEVQ
jgi:hypothetical protein